LPKVFFQQVFDGKIDSKKSWLMMMVPKISLPTPEGLLEPHDGENKL
jgi:hypothetical protein